MDRDVQLRADPEGRRVSNIIEIWRKAEASQTLGMLYLGLAAAGAMACGLRLMGRGGWRRAGAAAMMLAGAIAIGAM